MFQSPLFCRLVAVVIILLLLGTGCTAQGNRPDVPTPATYAEYKQWRKANNPQGQLYAEYKEWEAAYRLWQREVGLAE